MTHSHSRIDKYDAYMPKGTHTYLPNGVATKFTGLHEEISYSGFF